MTIDGKDKKSTVFIETYGCQMNKVDSEIISGLLVDNGFRITEDTDKADLVLINTCSVRNHAEQRALGRIGDARAVEPLIAAVDSEDKAVIEPSIRALAQIYKSSHISHELKQRILDRSRTDVIHHADARRHSDYMSSDCHKDSTTHTDESTEFTFSLT